MVDRCEAARQCISVARTNANLRCPEKAEYVRQGRRVCWSHKHSQSIRFYVDVAVPLETLLKISHTLQLIRRRQLVKDLRRELAKRQRSEGRKVCLLCANLSWRRAKPCCSGCGLPYQAEGASPTSSISPLIT